jgi:hypothetical protein
MGERPVRGQFKVKFTSDEDARLRMLVERFGTKDWSAIAREMPNRDARQCRERWTNYANPALIHLPWTFEEDALLDSKFQEYGTRWQVIALFFPDRSRNQIKNHWQVRHRLRSGPVSKRPQDPQPSDPPSQEVCQIGMSKPVLGDELFSEPRQQSILWDNAFAGFF